MRRTRPPHLPDGPPGTGPAGVVRAQRDHRQVVVENYGQHSRTRRGVRRPDAILMPQRRMSYLRHAVGRRMPSPTQQQPLELPADGTVLICSAQPVPVSCWTCERRDPSHCDAWSRFQRRCGEADSLFGRLRPAAPSDSALGALAWLDSGFWISGVIVLVVVGTFYGVWMARRMARYWPGAKDLSGEQRVAVARAVRRGEPIGDARLSQPVIDYSRALHAAAETGR